MDPIIFTSPSSKRVKNLEGTPLKVSKFTLVESKMDTNPIMNRKTLSVSVPTTTNVTPIGHSRGSPNKLKHRMHLLGGRRRSTPFKRVNPPGTATASPLPFSIDAALSGTISSYNPPPSAIPEPISIADASLAPRNTSISKAAPKSWFFEIHEDTPDQEASNLLQHSASVLDISSDDDAVTSRAKDAMERGKENIPPPEYTGPTRQARREAPAVHKGIKCAKKAEKYAASQAKKEDEMAEDRKALREMDATVFWDDASEESAAVAEKVEDVMKAPEVVASTTETAPQSASTEPIAVHADTV